jgi:endonuclease/exonuclease/phosphatase (EEP) superfamily protein YafD
VTVATQQHSLLVQHQDALTSPRKAFRRDLRAFLVERRELGEEIILVGDLNKEIGADQKELQMLNLMTARHAGQLPATYSRECKCIDYGHATHAVRSSLRLCGYEAFGHRFPSNH